MEPTNDNPTKICHVVAMPYPGRGHINPMMNFCKLLALRKDEILITFVVTEEWLGFLDSEPKPANFRFATIPNVIPSEIGRSADFPGFIKAVLTKLEEPFERLLDQLEPPKPRLVIHDTSLMWVADVGNRRNIPVASLWIMPASVFTVLYHFDLLKQNGHFPVDVSGALSSTYSSREERGRDWDSLLEPLLWVLFTSYNEKTVWNSDF